MYSLAILHGFLYKRATTTGEVCMVRVLFIPAADATKPVGVGLVDSQGCQAVAIGLFSLETRRRSDRRNRRHVKRFPRTCTSCRFPIAMQLIDVLSTPSLYSL